jgi:hypothetical protein
MGMVQQYMTIISPVEKTGRRLSIASSGSDRRLQLESSAFLSILSKVLTYAKIWKPKRKITLRLIQLQQIWEKNPVALSIDSDQQAASIVPEMLNIVTVQQCITSCFLKNVKQEPDSPALAVRPARWMYVFTYGGIS